MSKLLDLVKRGQMRDDLPVMNPGDTVRVHTRIVEGNKERVQVYEGVVIAIRRAQNASTITVRRISHASIGVERTFLMHSPRIDRFEVVRRGRVRRAKLYYLRDRQGKSARIRELQPSRQAAIAARIAPGTAAPVVEPAVVAPEAPSIETALTAPEAPEAPVVSDVAPEAVEAPSGEAAPDAELAETTQE